MANGRLLFGALFSQSPLAFSKGGSDPFPTLHYLWRFGLIPITLLIRNLMLSDLWVCFKLILLARLFTLDQGLFYVKLRSVLASTRHIIVMLVIKEVNIKLKSKQNFFDISQGTKQTPHANVKRCSEVFTMTFWFHNGLHKHLWAVNKQVIISCTVPPKKQMSQLISWDSIRNVLVNMSLSALLSWLCHWWPCKPYGSLILQYISQLAMESLGLPHANSQISAVAVLIQSWEAPHSGMPSRGYKPGHIQYICDPGGCSAEPCQAMPGCHVPS